LNCRTNCTNGTDKSTEKTCDPRPTI